MLPMPAGVERIYLAEAKYIDTGGEDIDLPLKSSIEGAVIRWASIVGDILKQDSTLAFAGGAHPTPSREVEFWQSRLKNLECIYDQLRDPRVKKMASYLEQTDSTYLPCFKSMFKSVVAGVVEARDITLYLKPLEIHFSTFEDNDFTGNEFAIKPLIHCIGLLWANSRYYCSSSKIVVLLKEVGNMMIDAVSRELDPSSVFQGEADDTKIKIDKCITLLEFFQTSFEYVRNNLTNYFNEEVEPLPWAFHPRNVFQRLMDFVDRLRLISLILETAIEFTKLEKVEIGGLKGRLLSQKCVDVFEDFRTYYNVFLNIQYDCLCPEDHSIIADYEVLKTQCEDLDRRLAAVFAQAFDDTYNLESIFKLKNIVGTLLDRPVIHACYQDVYDKILDIWDQELDTIKELFDNAKKNGAPIDKYYPPVAGNLLWLFKLKKRITIHYEMHVEQEFEDTEYSQHVFEKMNEMLSLITEQEKSIFQEWCARIPQVLETSLNKTHLVRDSNQLLKLNMDDELVALLREIRYMKDLEFDLMETVPDAMAFFERAEELAGAVMQLTRIVEWYNYMKEKTRPVEYDLINVELKELDEELETILSELTWKTNSKQLYYILAYFSLYR